MDIRDREREREIADIIREFFQKARLTVIGFLVRTGT